jgi:2-keto-3-deoxy-L-rhamnonate aldolase RhmA
LNGPEVAERLAGAGCDWLLLDAKHGTYSGREMQAMLQAAGGAVTCLVRVGAAEETAIKHALDAGRPV